MVIQILGPSVSLADVPGLRVSTSGDHIVTGVGTRASVEALAALPEVLSVKASVPGGAVVPHIGATLIHQAIDERGDAALIAVIDNGVDIFHEALRDAQGRTRIVALWDQRDREPGAPEQEDRARSYSPAGRELVEAFGLKYGAL
jgi:hypothetical protein